MNWSVVQMVSKLNCSYTLETQDHLLSSMWSGTEYLFIERKQFINFTLPDDFLTISFASIFRMRWKTKIQFDSFLLQTKS